MNFYAHTTEDDEGRTLYTLMDGCQTSKKPPIVDLAEEQIGWQPLSTHLVNAICAGAFDERSHGLRDSELLQVAALLVSFEKLLQFGKSRNAFVMAINGKGAGLRFGSICFECASRPMIDA